MSHPTQGAVTTPNATINIQQTNQAPTPAIAAPSTQSTKSGDTAYLLALFLGEFGAHRFYVGKFWSGLAMLLTGGLCGVWTAVDLYTISQNRFTDDKGQKLQFTDQNNRWPIFPAVVTSIIAAGLAVAGFAAGTIGGFVFGAIAACIGLFTTVQSAKSIHAFYKKSASASQANAATPAIPGSTASLNPTIKISVNHDHVVAQQGQPVVTPGDDAPVSTTPNVESSFSPRPQIV